MSVAGASLVVAVGLVALAAAAWLALRAAPIETGWPREHLPAVADWALVALTVHALALIARGAGFGAYAITFALACLATVLRDPPAARAPSREASPPDASAEPAPAAPPVPVSSGSLWADRRT